MIGALAVRIIYPRSFAAMGRKDLDAVCRNLAEDVVYEIPGRSAISGRYEGRKAIEEFWSRVFERYETFDPKLKHFALLHPFAFGATNTIFMEWVADVVTSDGRSMHAEIATVVEMRRGKAVHVTDYFFNPSLLDGLWGPAQADQVAIARPEPGVS